MLMLLSIFIRRFCLCLFLTSVLIKLIKKVASTHRFCLAKKFQVVFEWNYSMSVSVAMWRARKTFNSRFLNFYLGTPELIQDDTFVNTIEKFT